MKSLILLCLLVFSSCGRQELGDRDRNYDEKQRGYNDDRDNNDNDRNSWRPRRP